MEYQNFLEKNIDKVKKYKEDWYDKYEIKELQLTKDVIDKYYNIQKLIKNSKNKQIFKNFFINTLNKHFNWWFSQTDKRDILKLLTNINEKINILEDYNFETNLKNELENLIKENYKQKLNNLKEEILSWKEININNKIKEILLASIPWNKNLDLYFNIELEKSFLDEIKNLFFWKEENNEIEIKWINLLKLWISYQVFILESNKEKRIFIRKNNNFLISPKFKEIKYNIENNKFWFSLQLLDNNNYIIWLIDNKWFKKIYLDKDTYEKTFQSNVISKLFWPDINIEKISYLFNKIEEKKWKISKSQTIKKSKKEIKTIDKKTKIKETENLYSNNLFNKLPLKKRIQIIDNLLNTPELKKHMINIINKLENKSVTIKDELWNYKTVKFTKNFIKNNKNELLENFKNIIELFIFLESSFNSQNKHSKSSAKWLWQWLTENWKYKYKNGKKYRATSSFETALNIAYKKYGAKFKWISYPIKEKINLSPLDLNVKEQVILMMYTLANRDYKQLMWALLGNEWSIKVLYSKYIWRTQLNWKKCKDLNCLKKKEIENIKSKFNRKYFTIYDPIQKIYKS